EEPLRVDFDRPSITHLTFASGFHRCIGSHLARLEIRLGIEEFHRRIPNYWVDPRQQPCYIDMGIRAAISLPLCFAATSTPPSRQRRDPNNGDRLNRVPFG